ncbi:MAG: M1 aminopeptidase family protein [Gemmatimonadales bacterium]
MRSLLFLVLVAAAGGCAKGAAPRDILPSPKAGLVVYQAEVGFRLDAGALDVDATLHLPASAATGDTIRLLLSRGLTVRSVTGEGVSSHRVGASDFSPAWQIIAVGLEPAPEAGSVRTIRLSYSGRPEFPGDGINAILPTRVELNLDSQWFPIPARIDHELVGDLRVRVPQDWQVASGGVTDQDSAGHVVRTRVPQVDVAFSAAPTLREVAGAQFTVLYSNAGERAARAALTAAENCAGYLDARFGKQYPFPGGRIVLADRPGPGYARKNYIVLSNINPDSTEALQNFLCHEVAHYWTRFSGAMSPNYWLIETFAEYAAALYLRDRIGQAAFDRRRVVWETGGRSAGPVWTPETTARQSYAVAYRRGPHLLSLLEDRIGRESFARFIDGYMETGIASTAALLDHLQAVAGVEAADWFRTQLAHKPSPAR